MDVHKGQQRQNKTKNQQQKTHNIALTEIYEYK
jgi:hypothetical protein